MVKVKRFLYLFIFVFMIVLPCNKLKSETVKQCLYFVRKGDETRFILLKDFCEDGPCISTDPYIFASTNDPVGANGDIYYNSFIFNFQNNSSFAFLYPVGYYKFVDDETKASVEKNKCPKYATYNKLGAVKFSDTEPNKKNEENIYKLVSESSYDTSNQVSFGINVNGNNFSISINKLVSGSTVASTSSRFSNGSKTINFNSSNKEYIMCAENMEKNSLSERLESQSGLVDTSAFNTMTSNVDNNPAICSLLYFSSNSKIGSVRGMNTGIEYVSKPKTDKNYYKIFSSEDKLAKIFENRKNGINKESICLIDDISTNRKSYMLTDGTCEELMEEQKRTEDNTLVPETYESCEELLGEEAVNFINKLFAFCKIAVCIMTLVLSSYDFFMAIPSDDENALSGAFKKFKKRLILVISIFLLPVIINMLFSLIAGFGGFGKSGFTCGIK